MRRLAWLLFLVVVGCGRSVLGDESPIADAAGDTGADVALALDAGPVGDGAVGPDGDGAVEVSSPSDPLAALAQLCVLASSCGAATSPPQVVPASSCASMLATELPRDPVAARFYGCASARSCTALTACLGGNFALFDLFPSGSQCQGTRVVEPGGLTYDCAALGLSCVHQLTGLHASCASGPCGPNPTTTCSGASAVTCFDNIPSVQPCTGGTCSAGACVGSGAPCDPASTAGTCAGTVATNCVGGHLDSIDCASQPVRTECAGGRCTDGVDAGTPCLSGNSSCSGASVVVCADAVERTVDCASLGFTTCVPSVAGSNEAMCR